MRYELMRPSQIREAIKKRTPVVLPLGVLEYHSEHLPVGMDTLAVERALHLYEKEAEVVILPSFYWGASARAVAPWPGASRPLGVTKLASAPSAAARAFMSRANCSVSPATCSAMATAASLPERSMSPSSMSRMESDSPTPR